MLIGEILHITAEGCRPTSLNLNCRNPVELRGIGLYPLCYDEIGRKFLVAASVLLPD